MTSGLVLVFALSWLFFLGTIINLQDRINELQREQENLHWQMSKHVHQDHKTS